MEVVAMTMTVHFKQTNLGEHWADQGWVGNGCSNSVVGSIYLGLDLDKALHKVQVAKACSETLNDVKLISCDAVKVDAGCMDTCKPGEYHWRGFHIIFFYDPKHWVRMHFHGPIEHFEDFARLVMREGFSTNWLDEKPVFNPFDQHRSLAQRLTRQRAIGRFKK